MLTNQPLPLPPSAVNTEGDRPLATAFELLKLVLDTYREEYKDLLDAWGKIEAKVQGTVTIAGVFLAAAFALARDAATKMGTVDRLLLIASLSLLAACLVWCLRAVVVREVKEPPSGQKVQEYVALVVQAPWRAPPPSDVHRLFRDIAEIWEESVASLRVARERKAKRLRVAQVFLVLGLLLMSGLTIGVISTAKSPKSETATQ
jgi:hypothetical protein